MANGISNVLMVYYVSSVKMIEKQKAMDCVFVPKGNSVTRNRSRFPRLSLFWHVLLNRPICYKMEIHGWLFVKEANVYISNNTFYCNKEE